MSIEASTSSAEPDDRPSDVLLAPSIRRSRLTVRSNSRPGAIRSKTRIRSSPQYCGRVAPLLALRVESTEIPIDRWRRVRTTGIYYGPSAFRHQRRLMPSLESGETVDRGWEPVRSPRGPVDSITIDPTPTLAPEDRACRGASWRTRIDPAGGRRTLQSASLPRSRST